MRIDNYLKDFTVFDLETTGFSLDVDEIIEIGAVRFRDNQPVLKYETFVRPSKPVPIGASMINNISTEMAMTGLDPKESIRRFLEFIGDDVLVGHNIESFDIPFINVYAQKYFDTACENDYVDTVLIARQKLEHLGSRSLENLSKYYNVSYEGAHRAVQDCLITSKIYYNLTNIPVPEYETEPHICPTCSCLMKLRAGKWGMFWGCSNYPSCTATAKYIK